MTNPAAVFIVTLLALSSVSGQRVTCPAPKPCVCPQFIIDCEGKNLTAVPIFTASTDPFTILKLGNNYISRLDAAAFSLINVSTIYLNNNSLSTSNIDNAAFSGIENDLTMLDLSNNNINPLPGALSKLKKLKDLDVSGNPMDGYRKVGRHSHADDFTDSVMRDIGDSVTRFRFGHENFLRSWPESLNHLQQLEELVVSGSAINFLPSNAFHGFEQTLKSLTIEYARMSTVPLGISQLSSLQELHLDHMKEPFNDDSIIQAPFALLSSKLNVLSLDYDRLTVFPEVIKELTHLHNLSLDGNDLQFISDEAITLLQKANVSILSLKNCNLQRVPGAISDLSHLRVLDLSENKIRSIETTDLQNLGTLNTLSLAKNPLKYISNNSLCGLNNLRQLDLYSTDLTDISQAFRNLRNLEKMDVRDSRIDCTCDMWWMKRWQETCRDSGYIEIEGQCETIIEDIQSYITHRLATCLDYQHQSFTCGGTCNS